MDSYDSDHPNDTSPWASSPQQARPIDGLLSNPATEVTDAPPQSPLDAFETPAQPTSLTTDVPTLAAPQQKGQDAIQSPFDAQPPADSMSTPAQPQTANSQQPPATQQSSNGRGPQAQRYHNNRPQRPAMQYRMTAKITALERTGKKDPILRFDVQVRYLCALLYTSS